MPHLDDFWPFLALSTPFTFRFRRGLELKAYPPHTDKNLNICKMLKNKWERFENCFRVILNTFSKHYD